MYNYSPSLVGTQHSHLSPSHFASEMSTPAPEILWCQITNCSSRLCSVFT